MSSMPPSLQNFCFLQVVGRLKDYPLNVLALLLTHLRRQLLFRLPVVDVCQLEKTFFAEGIDMEAFWGELFERHLARYDKETFHEYGGINFIHTLKKQTPRNRELYLSFIASVVLYDTRPSGYVMVTHNNRTLVNKLKSLTVHSVALYNDLRVPPCLFTLMAHRTAAFVYKNSAFSIAKLIQLSLKRFWQTPL